jgi:hypothetical protein
MIRQLNERYRRIALEMTALEYVDIAYTATHKIEE